MSILAARDAVNVAGQPSKVGGGIVSVLGWLVLAAGALVTLAVVIVSGLIWTMSSALWIGSPVAALTLAVALPLFYAGRRLRRSGEGDERAAQERAIFALAARHRGALTARLVARSIEISAERADALLTALAKAPDSRVGVEVDDNSGDITYVFRDLVAASEPAARVRIPAQGWQAPMVAPVPAQGPRIIDAELIEEEEDGEHHRAGRRAER
jgi:hypothetical protein